MPETLSHGSTLLLNRMLDGRMSETIDIVQPVLERHHRMREMCSSSPPTHDSFLTHLPAQLSQAFSSEPGTGQAACRGLGPASAPLGQRPHYSVLARLLGAACSVCLSLLCPSSFLSAPSPLLLPCHRDVGSMQPSLMKGLSTGTQGQSCSRSRLLFSYFLWRL